MNLPFDPILRSREIERIVMHGDQRMYYRFRFANFYGGIVTADAVGSNQFRISGAEPILERASTLHLAAVIKIIKGYFMVETNGIMLGYDNSLVDLLKPLNCHVRLMH